MADTTWTPVILSASFSLNPVPAGTATVLSVLALDASAAEQTVAHVSNEFYSGEV